MFAILDVVTVAATLFKENQYSRHQTTAVTVEPTLIAFDVAVVGVNVEKRIEPPCQAQRENVQFATVNETISQIEARPAHTECAIAKGPGAESSQ